MNRILKKTYLYDWFKLNTKKDEPLVQGFAAFFLSEIAVIIKRNNRICRLPLKASPHLE
jgi:hypothetical protein